MKDTPQLILIGKRGVSIISTFEKFDNSLQGLTVLHYQLALSYSVVAGCNEH